MSGIHCGPNVDQRCVNDIFLPSAFYTVLMIEDRKVKGATNVDGYTMLDILARSVLSESGQLEKKHAGR